MENKTMEEISTHLQFLGYEALPKEGFTIFKNPKKINFVVKPYKSGFLTQAIFSCTDSAKSDVAGYLRVLNTLNQNASVARFYADTDSDLIAEAWYPDMYAKDKFASFMECWDSDSNALILQNFEDLKKYMK